MSIDDLFKEPKPGSCPATMIVAKMADLPLDCALEEGHEGPHRDSVTNARWVP
jgi:hypothetical protein